MKERIAELQDPRYTLISDSQEPLEAPPDDRSRGGVSPPCFFRGESKRRYR